MNYASVDLYVFTIIIAVIIVRIGCFLFGTKEPTFGLETTFFTGMNLGDGLKRHPVMLDEMGFMLVILMIFRLLKSKELINCYRFKLFKVLGFLFRFMVQFIKPYHPIFLNLSSIQWCALIILCIIGSFLLGILEHYFKLCNHLFYYIKPTNAM